jgi:hypothetical protein
LASRLESLAKDFPAYCEDLNKLIRKVRHRGNEKADKVQEAVVHAMRDLYCTTIEEICEETDYTELAVLNCLDAMLALRMVKQVERESPSCDRAPEMIWLLTQTEPSTLFVIP